MAESKKKVSNRLLITQQEMVLIKNSEEVKNVVLYGNLFDCLDRYKKLSNKDLEQNLAFDQKARVVLLDFQNKKNMMDNIMKEWYSSKEFDVADTKLNCQLCGRDNRYIFYIHNKLNNNDLHIGSDCVTKFPSITGIQQERTKLSQLKQNQARQKRKVEFEVLEGENLGFLSVAEEQFKNFKVMLPLELHNRIKDTLYQMNLIKTSYTKSGGNLQEAYEKYAGLRSVMVGLLEQAEKHQESSGNCLLACDKDSANWLFTSHPKVWEEVARNNGIFSEETLKKMYYPKFFERMLPEIRKHIGDIDIKIRNVNGNNVVFSIKNKRYYYPVIFSMPIKKFMESVGCLCLTDQSYSFTREVLQNISIENTRRNFDAVCNSILSIMRKNGYDFVIEEKTEQVYLKKLPYQTGNKWSSHTRQVDAMYKKLNINIFLSTMSPYLLQEEDVFERAFKGVIRKLEGGSTWLTQQDKDRNEQIAREARGMQKQREFIAY